ncbi:MAG: YSC84-related protein [Acidaminococcaceae bacterium]|jgi:lipid-binding SYLF domain-containing protein|nr:hypothetical protein [Acidaminococcaceae bacterium]MCI2109704.1 YSC84-related protein [Acidaminococcaceae bacterium]
MKGKFGKVLVSLMVLFSMMSATALAKESLNARKAEVRAKVASTLQLLYKKEPLAKKAVEMNAGYAVFVNSGYKLGLIGSGHGRGMAVNNDTKQEVFMKMQEYTVGLGLGAKEYAIVFIFLNNDAYKKFTTSNWKCGAQAQASATDGVVGDEFKSATKVDKYIWAYELTTKGLTAELDLKGTNYYRDKSFYPKNK